MAIDPNKETSPPNLTFHYIKANAFRVVHADGIWGGPTPRGYITMSFFSERAPIPTEITHASRPAKTLAGVLGPELGRKSKEGIIREVEVEVVVDLPMAKGLITWLQGKIDFLEKLSTQTGEG